MKSSLTRQMFVTLLSSFLVLITVMVTILIVYFQYFYEEEKIKRVVDNINTFAIDYEDSEWDQNQLYQNVSNFNYRNSMDLWVYNSSEGQSIYYDVENAMLPESESYYYLTVTKDGIYYDFMLDREEYLALRSSNKLKNIEGIYLEGYVDDYNFLIVEKIDNIYLDSSKRMQEGIDMTNMKSFEGEVVLLTAQEIFDVDYNQLFANNFSMSSSIFLNEYTDETNSDAILSKEMSGDENGSNKKKEDTGTIEDALESVEVSENEVEQPKSDEGDDLETSMNTSTVFSVTLDEQYLNQDSKVIEGDIDSVHYVISGIPYTDYRQVVFTKTVDIGENVVEYYATLSLQPVSELLDVIITYVPYYILIALIMSILISSYYSQRVSKPIVHITKVANKMADMELDVELAINRRDELGELSGSLNVMAFQLKEAMDELVRKNKQLERDVEIKQAQEEARKTFVANASHELKTPLGIVKSYAEAIADGVKKEKQDYYMDVIMDEIEHMNTLILEMLQLSKFDAKTMIYNNEILDVGDMIENVITSSKQVIDERGLSVDLKLPMAKVLGDDSSIYQVISNLVGNAIKYANENSTIRIEAISKSNHCMFYFYNDAQLFTEMQMEKIWNRFYKVDESHNRQVKGHGLGLAIVKTILDEHETEYGVYNTRKGVCFYFSLPLTSENE